MHHTKEELRQQQFFKLSNQLTERFFQGKEINLKQLAEFVANGTFNREFVIPDSIFSVIKTVTFQGREITILKLLTDIKGNTFTEVLKKDFEPFLPTDTELEIEHEFLQATITEHIVKDSTIYYRTKKGGRNFRHPSVYGFSQYDDPEKEPCFYMLKKSYGSNEYGKIVRTKVGPYFGKPPIFFMSGTLIVTGKSKD